MFLDIRNRWRNHFSSDNTFDVLNLKILITALIIYLLNEIIVKKITSYNFAFNYLNDSLSFVILLSYSNILLSFYRQKDIRIKNPIIIFVFVIITGLFWENVTPIYNKRSTGDVFDLLFYLLSGAFYYILIRLFDKEKEYKI